MKEIKDIEQEKHVVWHNDACDIYDVLKEEMEGENDNSIWQAAHDQIEIDMDDTKANLNKEVPGQLIAIGTLERWDKSHSAYKKLNASTIGEGIFDVTGSFDGDNAFHVYVQGNNLYVEQTGHDNPTNPSVFEIRYLTVDLEDLEDDKTTTLLANSKPVGDIVSEIYGW